MLRNLVNVFHILIIVFILSIPFLPRKCLKYAVFIPSLLYLTWLLFDGCPLTHATHGKKSNFIKIIFKSIFPKCKINTEHLNGFVMTFILAIVAFRYI